MKEIVNFKNINFKMFTVAFCSYVFWQSGLCQSNVITANSCSREDVQSAIELAEDGDTVVIPAGNCTWTETLIIDPMPAITLEGEGMDETIITDATLDGWMNTPLWIVGINGKPFRITGITFEGTSTTFGALNIRGTCKNFRVDHCEFDDLTGRGIMTNGHTYGVIDHCVFRECRQGVTPGCDAEDSWERPLTLGTKNAIYIEDCLFDNITSQDGAIDAYSGGRYVFRYNTVSNTNVGHHGLCGSTRSTFSFEIYENTIETDETLYRSVVIRGGSGVIFNNTFSNYHVGITVTNYRTCHNEGSTCDNFGRCDGTNPLDGNRPGMMGYPCLDQIGRSTHQILDPMYEWDNTLDGEKTHITVTNNWTECDDPSPFDHIQENRDFYNNKQRPGYNPYIYPHPLVQQWPPAPQTDFIVPTAPQNFTATVISESEIELNWDPCTDNGGSGMAGYYIWLNGQKVSSNSDSSYSTYVMRGLLSDSTYDVAVSSFDRAGNESEPSEEISISFPVNSISNINDNCNTVKLYQDLLSKEFIIEIDLRQQANVNVSLHDLTGRKLLSDHFDSQFSAGVNKIKLNKDFIVSGIYLVKINIGNDIIVKKCFILK